MQFLIHEIQFYLVYKLKINILYQIETRLYKVFLVIIKCKL